MTGKINMIVEFAAALVAAAGAAAGLFTMKHRKGHGVSILIPFRCPDKHNPRVRNFEWLKRYWKAQLPGAEVIVGDDPSEGLPFSKSAAVNNAVAQASGDVYVVVDADGYIDADSVMHCVKEIRDARAKGRRLWFIPYRLFFRLTEEASLQILHSDPAKPHKYPSPIHVKHTLTDATDPKIGHWYGAMIQIMPSEAFEIVGGWDERFRGWGGEDHAAMRAMDTLYAPHKTLPGQVLHIWHPQLGPKGSATTVHWKERMWENQQSTGANDALSHRYYGAYRHPDRMRRLLDEGKEWVEKFFKEIEEELEEWFCPHHKKHHHKHEHCEHRRHHHHCRHSM